MTEDFKQVTVGFKVTALQKREIEAAAKRVGVDVSTYLRDMLLGGHEKVRRFTNVPDELVIHRQYPERVSSDLAVLKSKHKKHSCSGIIAASLKVAAENEKRLVSNKIKNYLT